MTTPDLIVTPTLTQGHTLNWSPGTTYQPNMNVIDRSGIWLCLVENKNSRPISGNTDWTLVAGAGYVDVLLTPVILANAPLMTTGFEILPAPGAGLMLQIWGAQPQYVLTVTDGDNWTANGGATKISMLTSPGGSSVWNGTDIVDFLTGSTVIEAFANVTQIVEPNNSVIVQLDAGSLTGGTRSAAWRLFYSILPISTASP